MSLLPPDEGPTVPELPATVSEGSSTQTPSKQDSDPVQVESERHAHISVPASQAPSEPSAPSVTLGLHPMQSPRARRVAARRCMDRKDGKIRMRRHGSQFERLWRAAGRGSVGRAGGWRRGSCPRASERVDA